MDRWSGVTTLPTGRVIRRITRLASLGLVSVCASCGSSLQRSSLITLLEAIQRPFDLTGVTVLGVPAEPPAHLLLSALLAGLLAWWWRPLGAGVLIGALVLAKEALDLGIVALYEPVTWTYASDSVLDLVVSAAGVAVGLLAARWIRSRRGP